MAGKFFLTAMLFVVVCAAGCAGTPTRHLASDAAMIQTGVTTRLDVRNYFGVPQEERRLADGRDEWIYRENRKSTLRAIPYVGKHVGDEEQQVLVIRFTGNLVAEGVLRSYESDRNGPASIVQK